MPPIQWFECTECGAQFRSKKLKLEHCDKPMKKLITAPQTKFLEKVDVERGRSALVGQQKILTERARKHSRDVELGDYIETNDKQTAYQSGWLNKDGTRRKAIDDL